MRCRYGNFRDGGGRLRGPRDSRAGGRRELRSRGHNVVFIGTRRGMEATLVPQENFPIEWIEIGGLNRVGMRQTLVSLAELPWSVWQAARVLDRAKPAAVFSTGGYVAGPVLLAALWKRVPVVVIEPNAIPGFTHRRLATFVARALLSFPRDGTLVPAGTHRSDRSSAARRIFSSAREAARQGDHRADYRRQPRVPDAESRGGGKLASVERFSAAPASIKPAQPRTPISRRIFARLGWREIFRRL